MTHDRHVADCPVGRRQRRCLVILNVHPDKWAPARVVFISALIATGITVQTKRAVEARSDRGPSCIVGVPVCLIDGR
jgi:hypothetical protein